MERMGANERIYSAAYIMPSGKSRFGYEKKHQNNLKLLEYMMESGLPQQVAKAKSLEELYEVYYTDENIVYFEDYSIEKVIELSEVSKKWNDKFRLADASKEEFLKLPICKKVKDIIDESSVNEYVKSKKTTKG